MGWDSAPADPQGVPAARHARWLEEAFYELWRQGVDTIVWLLVRDQAPVPSFAQTYQSGVFLIDGTPKLAARAYAFPFVARAVGHGRAQLWGLAPAAGTVTIQRRAGARWTTVARLRPRGSSHIFGKLLPARRGVRLRACSGAQSSLSWTVGS
jgi:hypothetical protein